MKIIRRLVQGLALVVALAAGPAMADTTGALRAEAGHFVLDTADGRRLTSKQLVGAILEVPTGSEIVGQVRIDKVEPAAERPDILLHAISVKRPDGSWVPACSPDAKGRQAGFPIKGTFDGRRFHENDRAWYFACSSGSQAKCALWGYAPWKTAPDGRPMVDLYRACQQMVRADYEGRGEPHTRNGTMIDVADVAGVQKHDMLGNPDYAFEAGWGVDGAVCVARTRWPDLITLEALLKSSPQLAGPCDEATARARGALLFTRVQVR